MSYLPYKYLILSYEITINLYSKNEQYKGTGTALG